MKQYTTENILFNASILNQHINYLSNALSSSDSTIKQTALYISKELFISTSSILKEYENSVFFFINQLKNSDPSLTGTVIENLEQFLYVKNSSSLTFPEDYDEGFDQFCNWHFDVALEINQLLKKKPKTLNDDDFLTYVNENYYELSQDKKVLDLTLLYLKRLLNIKLVAGCVDLRVYCGIFPLLKINKQHPSKASYFPTKRSGFQFELRNTNPQVLKKLHHLLLEHGFLSDTPWLIFKHAFEKKEIVNKINWLEDMSTLYYFIKIMHHHKFLIDRSQEKWKNTANTFTCKGREIAFKTLKGQKKSKKCALIDKIFTQALP